MNTCEQCAPPSVLCSCGEASLATWHVVLQHLEIAQRMCAVTPWCESAGAGVVRRRLYEAAFNSVGTK